MIYFTHALLICGYTVIFALGSIFIFPMFGGDVTEFSILMGEVTGLTLWTLYLLKEAQLGEAKSIMYPLVLSAYAGLLVAYSWTHYGKAAMIYESAGWILLAGAILRLISIGWGGKNKISIATTSYVIVWVIISIGVATITAYTPHILYDVITRPLP